MLISEFADISGLSVDTLRYYDKIDLLVPERKDGNRWYTEKELKKAEEINYLKSIHFTLDEIQVILLLDKKLDKRMEEGLSKSEVIREEEDVFQDMKNMLEAKYQEVIKEEEKIQKAKSLLAGLRDKLNELDSK